ncbi:unnamed protein product [Rhizophagus irregularis]|nr:unnamed protein product [Rhizophagus irregularis]
MQTLISLNNDPSSPRQLAACIQKYGFTQLGGQTPYATVSSHISTHFSRVRNQVLVPNPIIITSSSPVKSESDVSIINGNQYCAETPPSTPSSMKDIEEDNDDVINKPISDSDNAETRFVE